LEFAEEIILSLAFGVATKASLLFLSEAKKELYFEVVLGDNLTSSEDLLILSSLPCDCFVGFFADVAFVVVEEDVPPSRDCQLNPEKLLLILLLVDAVELLVLLLEEVDDLAVEFEFELVLELELAGRLFLLAWNEFE